MEDQQWDVPLDKAPWLCPKPDPPVLVGTSVTDVAKPPVRLNVVIGVPPRTWGWGELRGRLLAR